MKLSETPQNVGIVQNVRNAEVLIVKYLSYLLYSGIAMSRSSGSIIVFWMPNVTSQLGPSILQDYVAGKLFVRTFQVEKNAHRLRRV